MRRLSRRRNLQGLVLALSSSLTALPVTAQNEAADYPTRVVTLINPFAPGASTDIVARLVAQKLAAAWGKPMVVENRPGAAGSIGLTAVARSPADGYMLGMIIVSHAAHAALQGSKSTLDLVRDFSHITQVAVQPYVLVVNPSLPARSVKELVALARASPGALTFGSSGVGSSLHLAGELLAALTKVQMTHVPYKGAALALAVTTAERVPGLNLPTVQESGVTGVFEVSSWFGIGAAAATPAAIVERLNQDIHRVLRLADVRERFAAEGALAVSGTPAQFAEMVRADVEKWRRVVSYAGLSPG